MSSSTDLCGRGNLAMAGKGPAPGRNRNRNKNRNQSRRAARPPTHTILGRRPVPVPELRRLVRRASAVRSRPRKDHGRITERSRKDHGKIRPDKVRGPGQGGASCLPLAISPCLFCSPGGWRTSSAVAVFAVVRTYIGAYNNTSNTHDEIGRDDIGTAAGAPLSSVS